MHVVKSDLLFILVFIPSNSCVLIETLQIFSTYCHLSFEGGGGGGSKRKLRELSFLSDINIFTLLYLGVTMHFSLG